MWFNTLIVFFFNIHLLSLVPSPLLSKAGTRLKMIMRLMWRRKIIMNLLFLFILIIITTLVH